MASTAVAAEGNGGNFTVGVGPVGNIFVVETNPELDPGIGGYVYFDYRWSPQFSTQVSVVVTTEDGKGNADGDNGIVLMGIPTFDIKFYFVSEPSRWDPYGLIGMGVYAVTEGSQNNGTWAIGIGANLGLGTDFYITERFSVGLAASSCGHKSPKCDHRSLVGFFHLPQSSGRRRRQTPVRYRRLTRALHSVMPPGAGSRNRN